MNLRQKAEMYREFGWRWNRRPYRPLVFCYASPRFASPLIERLRPMLAYECRLPHNVLWAFDRRWGHA